MSDRKETLVKHLVAGFAALVAFIAYALTMAPTVSFWDCGEFIACSNILGIPHPPGTPFFVMIGRAAIVLLPFVEEVAKRVNYVTVITSAMAIYVTALLAWDLLVKGIPQSLDVRLRRLSLVSGSLIAAFLLTFSDTFWFNAVEAEVYGFAMFLVLLISWLAVKWVDVQRSKKGDRLLVLMCYLAFLGVGVHLYTLLTIPAVFLLLLIADKERWRAQLFGAIGLAVLLVISAIVVYVVNWGVVRSGSSGVPSELFVLLSLLLLWKVSPDGVRIPRWPVWFTGVVVYSVVYKVDAFLGWSLVLLVGLGALRFLAPKLRRDTDLSLLLTFVALLGMSTHAYIPVRSALDPRVDENDPEVHIEKFSDLFDDAKWDAFNQFLERKQYGSESMITRSFHRRGLFGNQLLTFPNMGYGGYQLAQYLPFKVGQVGYYSPGLYSIDPEDNPPVTRPLGLKFPTQMMLMGENEAMQFFWFLLLNALIGGSVWLLWKRNRAAGTYMGALYLLCSAGLLWYINFADGMRLEKRDGEYWKQSLQRDIAELSKGMPDLPDAPDPNKLVLAQAEVAAAKTPEAKEKAESQVIWQNWKRIQAAYTKSGYQPPNAPEPVHQEVRERDYFYTPAFIFMSVALGVGAGLFLLVLVERGKRGQAQIVGPALTVLAAVVPAFSNWTEHDRSGNWVPKDYAYNLLESCRPNGILFTNGDNDTFPLWFAQEVAGIRTDVRVVNLSLGNTDWYIRQLRQTEPKLRLSYTDKEINEVMTLTEANAASPEQRVDTWLRKAERAKNLLESQQALLGRRADSLAVVDSAAAARVKAQLDRVDQLLQVQTALVDWGRPRRNGYMKTQDKLVIDLVEQNPSRPIHFATTVSTPNMVGLEKYMIMEGMVYTLQRGDLTVRRDDMNVARTRNLVDSVYMYRGLGDGTANINLETERLLFNYNSIYIRLALEARQQIVSAQNELLQIQKPQDSTAAPKEPADKAALTARMEQNLSWGLRYIDLGIKQFPDEWRNYAVAAELLEVAGHRDQAIQYLERGVQKVPERAREDLSRRLEYLKGTKG